MLKIQILLLSLIASMQAVAAGSVSVDDVLAKYAKAQVKMKLEQITKSMYQKKARKATGEMFLSEGKLRIVFTAPEKSLLVYDGKFVWSEEASPTNPKNVNVTKAVLERSQANKTLLSVIGGKVKPSKVYKINKIAGGALQESYSLLAKDKKAAIQEIKLKIDKRDNTISTFSFLDDIGNETTLNFSEIEMNAKLNSSSFVYKAKAGNKVNEL